MDKAFKIAVMLTAYDKMSQIVGSAVNKSNSKLKHLSHHFNEMSERAMIVGEVGKEFFMNSVEAAETYESSVKRLNQVFKSMHQNQAEATEQSEKYAESLSTTVGVEREVILATQAKIATFKHVANEAARANGVYERATKAAVDMQATGFGDATTNAVQLGKALEDPIKGINSLRRSGITFSQAERDKIKLLVESGQRFKAQHLILKAIETQVGGVAKATVKDTDKMRVAWKNTQVQIGTLLLPMFAKLTEKVLHITKRIAAFAKEHPKLFRNAAIVTGAMLAFGVAAKVIGFVLNGLIPIVKGVATAIKWIGNAFKIIRLIFSVGGGPIIWIIMGIALAVFLIIKYWKPIKAFFIRLWDGIKKIFTPVINILKGYIMNFTPIGWIIRFWKPLSKLFSAIWELVKAVFVVAFRILKFIIMKFTPVGLIIKHWAKISGFFKELWDKAKAPFIAIYKFVKGLGKRFYEAGANIINSIIKGITSKIDKITNTVRNVANKIRNFFPFSPAKDGPLKDIHKIKLMETVAASISAKPLTDAVGRSLGQLASFQPSGSKGTPISQAGGGTSITLNYAPVINPGVDKNSIMDILEKDKTGLMKQIDEVLRQKARVSL